ncbi:MAG TPA: metal-dependent hydrolase [Acidilobales archaeon]|nr:metal-dependent hydrolase [Acidilobales archaeon]
MNYVRWLGHAAFEVFLESKLFLIDPWLTNPKSPVKVNDYAGKVDYVIVTHDHGDHFGETLELMKVSPKAKFIGIFELAQYVEERFSGRSVGANIGGPIDLGEGFEVILTPAYHSSSKGSPTGVVIKVNDYSIYHAGDTGLFAEMSLIGELYKPKIALLPIGGHFTMGPKEAAKAIELLKPKVVIPMHYGTFPVIKGTPEELKVEVKRRGLTVDIVVLQPGEKYEF